MFPLTHSKTKRAKNAKQAETLSLVIDIESGLVRAAIIVNVSGMPPRVAHTVSSPIVNRSGKSRQSTASHSGTSQSSDLPTAMLKSLKEVAGVVATKAIPDIRARGIALPISKIHCALSSPWIVSKTKTVKVDFGKETELTREAINKIIDGERADMEQKFPPEHRIVTVEQKIFEIKLNGYPVTHFQGKRTRELEMSFAVTVTAEDILAQIRETLSVSLVGSAVEFHSSLLLQYAALRNLVSARNDYIAAHVHNDLSDIIVVRRGVCSILASFPFGTASFVEKSSRALDQSQPLTRSALSLRAAQKLSSDGEKIVADASDPIIREWAVQFFKTLAAGGAPDSLPRLLVLSVRDHFPYFEKALKNETQGAQLDITPLDEVILEKAVSYDRGQDANALVTMYAFALNPDMHADLGERS